MKLILAYESTFLLPRSSPPVPLVGVFYVSWHHYTSHCGGEGLARVHLALLGKKMPKLIHNWSGTMQVVRSSLALNDVVEALSSVHFGSLRLKDMH